MKKYLVVLLLGIIFISFEINKGKLVSKDQLTIYINGELQESIPAKGEAMFYKAICDSDVEASWDNDAWSLFITNLTQKTKCNLYFYKGETIFDFDYTGEEQTFITPVSGTYKLETWGAQGGSVNETYIGGTGSYSTGVTRMFEKELVYINIGGQGATNGSGGSIGGYNGGGNGFGDYCAGDKTQRFGTSGGGATHISKSSGLLANLKDSKDDILIVSGGGGGAFYFERAYGNGAAGGGIKGNSSDWQNNGQIYKIPAQGGTQFGGGSSGSSYSDDFYINSNFGLGGTRDGFPCNDLAGGGGGYYGGGDGSFCPAAGGSGYIGNSLLIDKAMYCYNCEESSEESTKTISTTCSEETPTENCAKKGNGYARITLVSID